MSIVYARVAPKRDTKENWSEHPDFVPLRGEIIIYTDYKIKTENDGTRVYIPGLKVGDGRTHVNDLPFIDFGSGGVVDATINGVPVEGDLTLEDLGIQAEGDYPDEEMSGDDIDDIIGTVDDITDIAGIIAENDYVELETDGEIESQIIIDHDIEVDLAGHTIFSEFASPMFSVTDGTLTLTGCGTIEAYDIAEAKTGGNIIIKNGTYIASNCGFVAYGDGSKITMNDGNIVCVNGAIGAFDEAQIEVNGGTITCSDNYCIFTNKTDGRGENTITLNDGILVGSVESVGYESVVIYIANNDIFVMNGGTIVSTNGCGIIMRGGSVTINGGSVETRGTGAGGMVGDSPAIMDHSAVIYHETANFPGEDGMSLRITGGKFIGVEHSVNVLSNEVAPRVIITGGEFTPAYPEE